MRRTLTIMRCDDRLRANEARSSLGFNVNTDVTGTS